MAKQLPSSPNLLDSEMLRKYLLVDIQQHCEVIGRFCCVSVITARSKNSQRKKTGYKSMTCKIRLFPPVS